MRLLLRRHPKGQVLVLVALLMVVIIGVAALAIDIGMAYGLKAKLNAAADAAAIAALRERTSPTGSDSTAEAAARSFLLANYPYEEMGVAQPVCEVNVSRDGQNTGWKATVTASTTLPTRFAAIIGWEGLNVMAKSEATKLDLDLALVLGAAGSLSGFFETIKDRAIDFVNRFNESNDRVALVPFATGVSVTDVNGELVLTDGVDIRKSGRGFSKAAMNQAINNLTAANFRASEFGMRMGMYQLQKASSPAQQRAIVFFSDGAPNTFAGVFPSASGTFSGTLYSGFNTPPTQLYMAEKRADNNPSTMTLARVPTKGGGNFIGTYQIPEVAVDGQRALTFYDNPAAQRCDVNKAARNLLETIANQARSQGVTIYSLGYGTALDAPDIDVDCSTSLERGSTIMKRIANTADSDTYNPKQPTGIYCYAQTPADLGPCFHTIANSLLRLTK